MLAIPDGVGYFKTDNGGRDRFHHVDPWSSKNGIVGDGTFKIELRDDIEWISTNWQLNHAGRTCLVPVESIEK